MSIEKVLEHAKIVPLAVEYLGEGAWHDAWKVSTEKEILVVRQPKKVAYGKEVTFDVAALNAEYGATKMYYEAVNTVMPNYAPATFTYYVSPPLTYTMESYGGEHIDLRELTQEEAFEIGKQFGGVYKKVEQVTVEISGLGYIKWSEEKGLHGQFDEAMDPFMAEENAEIVADAKTLITDVDGLDDTEWIQVLEKICQKRLESKPVVSLTNQDASTENFLFTNDHIVLIDPYPIVYFGPVMAGNFVFLYEKFYELVYASERYRKHRFHEYKEALHAIANGFTVGYTNHEVEHKQLLLGEVIIQAVNMTFTFQQMIEKGMNKEQELRYGTEAAVQMAVSQLVDYILDKTTEWKSANK